MTGRPLLTTPPRLQQPGAVEQQQQAQAAQPWLGLGGLLLGAVVFFALPRLIPAVIRPDLLSAADRPAGHV